MQENGSIMKFESPAVKRPEYCSLVDIFRERQQIELIAPAQVKTKVMNAPRPFHSRANPRNDRPSQPMRGPELQIDLGTYTLPMTLNRATS
jgi:hypothetical protein